MLAALIATRQKPTPPPPQVIRYGNQLVAAVTTFTCISVVRNAGFIAINFPIQYQLNLSLPGHESFLDQLNRAYFRLIGQLSTNNPDYLSANIAQVIAIVAAVTPVLQTLPVAVDDLPLLGRLQKQLAIALAVLNSLAIRA